jgi:MFS family permease
VHNVDAVQRRTLQVLFVTQVAGGVGMTVGMSVGALLAADMVSVGVSGLAQSAAVMGAALLAIPATRIVRRFGRRPSLATAYGVAALGGVLTVIAAMTRSAPLLFAGFFLFGGGTTAGLQSRYAAVDLAPKTLLGRHLSIIVWASTLGGVVGPNLASIAGTSLSGYGIPPLAGPFVFSAALFVVAALVLIVALRPDPLVVARSAGSAAPATGPGGGMRAALDAVLANPAARLGIIATAVGHVVMVAVMAMTPVHIRGAGHDAAHTLRIVGLVLSVHVAGMYAFAPVMGWLSDRIGRERVILVGLGLLLGACATAGTAGHDTTRLAIGLVLLGLGWSATMVAGSALLSASISAEMRPSAQGLSDLVMGLAGASAGALSGVVVQAFGYPTLTLAAAIVTLPLWLIALRSPALVRAASVIVVLIASGCATPAATPHLGNSVPTGAFDERAQVLELYPGVTATIVAPARLDRAKPVELILYALPNGNSTAETMGRAMGDGIGWRHDIQHIAAQTRALRATHGLQAIVVYLEADSKSWPLWRSSRGYDRSNRRIVEMVDQIIVAIGSPRDLTVTLTGHSGGGSFITGFIDGQDALPSWLRRIAYLDANYSFEYRHGDKLVAWLRGDPRRSLVVLAYDDREIMLDGRKVVSDSGGTWRASARMMNYLREPFQFRTDTLGEFVRYRASQIDVLLHPNRENRILHTVMIGEMNGYMHALLARRGEYERGPTLLTTRRAYSAWIDSGMALPQAAPPVLPARRAGAMTGSAFIRSISSLSREERESAIRRELMAGNVPSFLRGLIPVEVRDDSGRVATIEVMPDYLAIGSDDDFVRIPMIPYTAQAFGDAFGFVLPTRKMVNAIWSAATVKIDPKPLTQERESPLTFLQHHRIIEEQLATAKRGALVAGHKKDVVVTNRLAERADRVAIYGWHYLDGKPIQQVYVGHVDWYVDYSHGIRPVRRAVRANGQVHTFEKVVGDSTLAGLLSDEGVMTVHRYPRP